MLVVHVGMGKTATSTLQRSVFPLLAELKGVISPPPEFDRITQRDLSYAPHERKAFWDMAQDETPYLISYEALVDWNPRNWEQAADRNLDLFSSAAVIVLTLRDPLSYLTSLYQQVVQQGNVLGAEEFFVRQAQYDALEPWLNARTLKRFDVDAFDLEHLVTLYRKRFDRVHVVPLPEIATLQVWQEIFTLTEHEKTKLQQHFAVAPRANVSYSKTAMQWTLIRERLLNAMYLRSVGSEDYLPDLRARGKSSSLRQLLFSHRAWMQAGLDKVLPYRKYELGADVDLNADLMARNEAFYAQLLA